MSYQRLINLVFREGCGLTRRKWQSDPEYKRILGEELTLYRRHPRSTHHGRVLDTGTHGVTKLSQWVADGPHEEGEYVDFAGHPVFYSRRTRRNRAKLRFLGKSLVRAAQACLPEEAKKLAKQWRRSSKVPNLKNLNRKIAILCQLEMLLSSLHSEVRKRTGPRYAYNSGPFGWVDHITEDYDYRDVFPNHVGVYGKTDTLPLCLGMAVLLAAWADLAGAKSMLANMIEHPEDMVWETEGWISQRLLDELNERALRPHKRLCNTLGHSVVMAESYERHVIDFHPALAIKVQEGYWWYIDPYMTYAGVIRPDRYSITAAELTIDHYTGITPGVSTVCDDRGFLQGLLDDQKKAFQLAIRASRRLEKLLKDAPTNQEELRPFLLGQAEVRELIVLLGAGEKTPEEAFERVAMLLLNVNESPKREARLAERWKKYDNPANWHYRLSCCKRVSRAYLVLAKKRYHDELKKLRESEGFLPPVLEFSHTEFGLALQVLNNARIWGPIKGLSGYWLANLTVSQIYWHEAVALDESPLSPYDEFARDRAEEHVRFLAPRLHRRVARKLHALDVQRGNTPEVVYEFGSVKVLSYSNLKGGETES